MIQRNGIPGCFGLGLNTLAGTSSRKGDWKMGVPWDSRATAHRDDVRLQLYFNPQIVQLLGFCEVQHVEDQGWAVQGSFDDVGLAVSCS